MDSWDWKRVEKNKGAVNPEISDCQGPGEGRSDCYWAQGFFLG